MYETILVPTDGSEHAGRAAEHALALAAAFDASVQVLAVADVATAAGLFSAGGVDRAFVERVEAAAREHAAAVEDVAGDRQVVTAVVRGEPVEEILERARAVDADLLAMGTHGRSGVRRALAGSVTESVLRRADAPVLTVRATERTVEEYGAILVPTDGSEQATAAVDHALAVAERTGASVHAVSVVDVSDMAGLGEYAPTQDLLERLRERAAAAAERVAERARDAGVPAHAAVREGRPASELLAYAEDADADLVAMGTRGRGGLRRLLLGSVTERVVRAAEIPVIAVRTDADRG